MGLYPQYKIRFRFYCHIHNAQCTYKHDITLLPSILQAALHLTHCTLFVLNKNCELMNPLVWFRYLLQEMWGRQQAVWNHSDKQKGWEPATYTFYWWCWSTCYIHPVLLMVLENLLYSLCSTDGVGEPAIFTLFYWVRVNLTLPCQHIVQIILRFIHEYTLLFWLYNEITQT